MAKKADMKVKKTNDDVELLQTSRKKAGKFEKAKPIKPKKRGNGFEFKPIGGDDIAHTIKTAPAHKKNR